MWTPHSVRGDDGATHLTGRVGDRLIVRFAGPVSGYDGCTWAGQVRKSLDGDPVASFTFTDLSTADDFDLTIIIEDTTVFVPGCTYVWDVRAVTGDPAPTTPLRGTLVGAQPVTDLSPPPSVSGLVPDTGSIAGGDLVMLTGSNLVDVVSVEFDGVSVAFTEVAPTLLTATTAAHAAGVVDVIVTTSNGDSLPTTFTFE